MTDTSSPFQISAATCQPPTTPSAAHGHTAKRPWVPPLLLHETIVADATQKVTTIHNADHHVTCCVSVSQFYGS